MQIQIHNTNIYLFILESADRDRVRTLQNERCK